MSTKMVVLYRIFGYLDRLQGLYYSRSSLGLRGLGAMFRRRGFEFWVCGGRGPSTFRDEKQL